MARPHGFGSIRPRHLKRGTRYDALVFVNGRRIRLADCATWEDADAALRAHYEQHRSLVGRQFGRLTVVCRERSSQSGVHWRCACECGRQTVVTASSLRRCSSVECLSCAAYRVHHGVAPETPGEVELFRHDAKLRVLANKLARREVRRRGLGWQSSQGVVRRVDAVSR